MLGGCASPVFFFEKSASLTPYIIGSSINAMMAQYGVASDFDEWAQIIKDDSWSHKHFSKYIRKFERYSPHPQHPSVDSGDRGNCGPVEVGYRAHLGRTNRAFVDTCPNVGIPISSDFNTEAGKKGANQVCVGFIYFSLRIKD
jgi:choline dehydrogenase